MPKKKLVLAVDFDGTCVEHQFPEVGPEMPYAAEVLRELSRRGHKIILHTCREDRGCRYYLSEAVEWFRDRRIPLRAINETHPEDLFHGPNGPLSRGRKPFADLYIDDKNLGGFPGWRAVLSEVARLEAA